jgi:hypothetical protein
VQPPLRLARVLGALPLIPAVGQDQAAVARARDQLAVGRLPVERLGAHVDHQGACLDSLGRVAQLPAGPGRGGHTQAADVSSYPGRSARSGIQPEPTAVARARVPRWWYSSSRHPHERVRPLLRLAPRTVAVPPQSQPQLNILVAWALTRQPPTDLPGDQLHPRRAGAGPPRSDARIALPDVKRSGPDRAYVGPAHVSG